MPLALPVCRDCVPHGLATEVEEAEPELLSPEERPARCAWRGAESIHMANVGNSRRKESCFDIEESYLSLSNKLHEAKHSNSWRLPFNLVRPLPFAWRVCRPYN